MLPRTTRGSFSSKKSTSLSTRRSSLAEGAASLGEKEETLRVMRAEKDALEEEARERRKEWDEEKSRLRERMSTKSYDDFHADPTFLPLSLSGDLERAKELLLESKLALTARLEEAESEAERKAEEASREMHSLEERLRSAKEDLEASERRAVSDGKGEVVGGNARQATNLRHMQKRGRKNGAATQFLAR